MKVFPIAKVQTLAECVPGQLVRSLEYGQAERLGLVFNTTDQVDEMRGIVELMGEVPTFEVEHQPDQMYVLAYSGTVVWDVDHNGPIETNARVLFGKSGALICGKDGWILNVTSSQGYGMSRTRMQFNLSTGELDRYSERLSKVAIFGAWSISLEETDRPHDRRIKMTEFKIMNEVR